jgi:hypothetical protein
VTTPLEIRPARPGDGQLELIRRRKKRVKKKKRELLYNGKGRLKR